MNAAGERLLQDLEEGLDGVPLGPTHVHNHCEPSLADFFTRGKENTGLEHTTLALLWVAVPWGNMDSAALHVPSSAGSVCALWSDRKAQSMALPPTTSPPVTTSGEICRGAEIINENEGTPYL